MTQGVDAIVTNSDGAPARREFLLALLGPGAEERVLDPGIDVVTERLSRGRRALRAVQRSHRPVVWERRRGEVDLMTPPLHLNKSLEQISRRTAKTDGETITLS